MLLLGRRRRRTRSRCVLKLVQPGVGFTFFNLYLLADIRVCVASHRGSILTTRECGTRNIVYLDAGNGDARGINLASGVITDVTD